MICSMSAQGDVTCIRSMRTRSQKIELKPGILDQTHQNYILL